MWQLQFDIRVHCWMGTKWKLILYDAPKHNYMMKYPNSLSKDACNSITHTLVTGLPWHTNKLDFTLPISFSSCSDTPLVHIFTGTICGGYTYMCMY